MYKQCNRFRNKIYIYNNNNNNKTNITVYTIQCTLHVVLSNCYVRKSQYRHRTRKIVPYLGLSIILKERLL